jgi:hypothetical protein
MDWLTLMAAAMKAQEDSTKSNQAAAMTAEQQKMAPYTKMQPKPFDPSTTPSALSTIAQGGVAGMQMNQNMAAQKQNADLNKAMVAYYQKRAGGGADQLTSGQSGTGTGGSGSANPWTGVGMQTASMYGSQAPGAAPDGYGTEGVNIDPSANPGAWNGSTMDALNSYGYA